MKGYSKLSDVHFALSENELLLEVKDAEGKVHKVAKTLLKEIVVEESSVELLVDFIAIKMKKLDKEAHWDQLGYDIREFTIPMKGQSKSNFMQLPKLAKIETPQVSTPSTNEQSENKENMDSNSTPSETVVVENEEEKPDKVKQVPNNAMCYMNLESSIIFKIY